MYYCPLCFDSCATEVIFMTHWKCKHTTLNSTFRCKQEKCSRVFSDVNVFKKHLTRVHNGDREYESKQLEQFPPHRLDIENEPYPALLNPILQPVDSSSSVTIPSQNCTSITPREFAGSISKSAALFIAKLYANPSLPRSFVEELVKDMKNITDHIEILKAMHTPNETIESQNLNQMFDIFQNGFIDHATEYQSLSYFQNMETLIMPEQFIINGQMEKRNRGGTSQLCYIEHTVSYVPLKKVLKIFLECPGVFNSIISFIEKAEQSDEFISVIQGTLWKSIRQKISGIVLPLIIYFDDFEINNPLGTHRCFHKIGAVYFTIACIPDEYASGLENIFLAQLHNTVDYDKCNNEQIFWKLIEQLIELETTGILINIDGVQIIVKFAMLTMAGDNLGLNSALGYYKCFNANYNCRACIANKEQRQNLILESSKLMRTEKNYISDVKKKEAGIQEECIFNKLLSFNAVRNVAFDPDHDLPLGIFRNETAVILCHLLNQNSTNFTLEILNDKIRFFNYNLKPGLNVPPPIKKEWLEKGQIMYTATEMLTFIHYLPLLIGLLVPDKDKYWQILLVLREIVIIVYAPKFTEEDVQNLERLVAKHHRLCKKLNIKLTPKSHFLIHYPNVMRKIGPLKSITTRKFEAKHQEMKNYAKVSRSRVNPSYSLSLKQQLLLNYRFLQNTGFDERLLLGVVFCVGLNKIQDFEYFKNTIPYKNTEKWLSTSWIEYCGTRYQKDIIITIAGTKAQPQFGKIAYTLLNELREVFFLYNDIKILKYVTHLQAFEVEKTENWGFISQKQLATYKTRGLHFLFNKKYYIATL